ncbi:MAG: DUF3467 domain-containing protein [Thermodesulfobacteriota bacterium]
MATAKPKQKKSDELKIEYIIPDYVISRFATNITVQKIENEFKVSFFELKQDILLDEEDKKKMIERGTVRADCIASIIITADRMPKFINAMSQQLNKYESNKKENKD